MIEISPQIAATLVLAILGMTFGFGKVLLTQFEKRMNERFNAQDTLREARLKSIEETQLRENIRLNTLTQDYHSLSQLLPMQYVRREDWIRFSAQIDHKLDRLGELFTRYTMRGPNE